MSALAARHGSPQPPETVVAFLASMLGGDKVRLISIDTTNPHGGRGGSLDSDQCAWLVRQLAQRTDRGVIVSTRHRSQELRNATTRPGSAPRVLRDELVSLLLAHPNVLGWISGQRHGPAGTRHGVHVESLWELTPSVLGFGPKAWVGLQQRRAEQFPGEHAAGPRLALLATA